MRKRRLLWRMFVYFLSAAAAALVITAFFAVRELRVFHFDRMTETLLARARMLAREIGSDPADLDPGRIDRLCKEAGPLADVRFTVVAADGRVLGDSDWAPADMDDHKRRPEIAEALAGRVGRCMRYSDTIRRDMLYVAVGLPSVGGGVAAVVRAAVPASALEDDIWSVVRRIIFFAGAVVAALFAVVAGALSRRIAMPLADMQRAAERLAAGDLSVRMETPADSELAALARTFNQTAAQLTERVQTVTSQRNELDAVLSSMIEGVVAIDAQERIISMNRAAAGMLGLGQDQAHGRSIQEAVRNPDLQEFVADAMAGNVAAEREIALYDPEERVLGVHAAPLTDSRGGRLGVLLVLNDITRLKRLETIRQDFVANASHELKTPITAIKGCVETLAGLEPGLPPQARPFVDMLQRHTDRLGAIAEDMLTLSSLEHEGGRAKVNIAPATLYPILARALQTFATRAEATHITLRLECPADLAAPVNEAMIEQAVSNLLDNAIKYGGSDTDVIVAAGRAGDWVEISVADHGPGIEKKHLSRIFERFYRVDPARSRAMGGTGLGLAIVKHIATSHGGAVSVQSTVGAGSTFTIRIPAGAGRTGSLTVS